MCLQYSNFSFCMLNIFFPLLIFSFSLRLSSFVGLTTQHTITVHLVSEHVWCDVLASIGNDMNCVQHRIQTEHCSILLWKRSQCFRTFQKNVMRKICKIFVIRILSMMFYSDIHGNPRKEKNENSKLDKFVNPRQTRPVNGRVIRRHLKFECGAVKWKIRFSSKITCWKVWYEWMADMHDMSGDWFSNFIEYCIAFSAWRTEKGTSSVHFTLSLWQIYDQH